MKKKRGFFKFILFIIIIGAIGFAFYLFQQQKEQERQELIQEYINGSSELLESLNQSSKNFEQIGLMFKYSAKLNNAVIGDGFLTDIAKGLSKAERTEEEERNKEIKKKVEDLNTLDCNEAEILEFKESVGDFYNSYNDLYVLLVDVNFKAAEFVELYSEYELNFKNCSKAAGDLLDKAVSDQRNKNTASKGIFK